MGKAPRFLLALLGPQVVLAATGSAVFRWDQLRGLLLVLVLLVEADDA